MNQRLLISRGLEQRSVRDLSFHTTVSTRRINYSTIPDWNLHCTLSLSDASDISLDALSTIIRNKPTSSDRHHESRIMDVVTLGRDQLNNKVSYALELELDDQLEHDYQYFRRELNLRQEVYIPHVTLLSTYGADKTTEQKIIDRICNNSPATIALSGIRAKVYTPVPRHSAPINLDAAKSIVTAKALT